MPRARLMPVPEKVTSQPRFVVGVWEIIAVSVMVRVLSRFLLLSAARLCLEFRPVFSINTRLQPGETWPHRAEKPLSRTRLRLATAGRRGRAVSVTLRRAKERERGRFIAIPISEIRCSTLDVECSMFSHRFQLSLFPLDQSLHNVRIGQGGRVANLVHE